jgi:hypothetical protein
LVLEPFDYGRLKEKASDSEFSRPGGKFHHDVAQTWKHQKASVSIECPLERLAGDVLGPNSGPALGGVEGDHPKREYCPLRKSRMTVSLLREKCVYFRGKVGTGFSHSEGRALLKKLGALERKEPPFKSVPRLARGVTRFVNPELVAHVNFTEWTSDGVMRHSLIPGVARGQARGRGRRHAVTASQGGRLTLMSGTLYGHFGAGVDERRPGQPRL